MRLQPLKDKVNKDRNELPYTVKADIKEILSELEQKVPKPPEAPIDFEGQTFIVHAYETEVDSRHVFKPYTDKPFLVLLPKKKKYTCYANVPRNYQHDNFNAELWIKSVLPNNDIKPSGAFVRTKKPFEYKNVEELLDNARLFAQQLE